MQNHPPILAATDAPIEFSQRKFGSETRFSFDLDSLKFVVKDKSGSNTITTQYNVIGTDRDLLIERNTWLQNAGYLWLALGAAFTAISYFSTDKLQPSIWLFVGAACVAFAHFRTVRYTKLHTEKGALFIINDAQHDAILQQIESRRTGQLRRWYDFFDAEEDAVKQRSRFEWLHRQGALSESELADRVLKLDSMVRVTNLPDDFIALSGGSKSLN